MTVLAHLRRRPRLIRSVFAVFVLAWLQTAIVPCAMAITKGSQDTQATLAQSRAADTQTADLSPTTMADMPGCVYCPSEQKQSDDVGSGMHGCLYPHESRVDSGKAQQLQLDQLIAHPTYISSSVFSFLLEPNVAWVSARSLIPPQSERSLNLTHCKQLK